MSPTFSSAPPRPPPSPFQADAVIGSLYSNYARLALQLAATAAHRSYDALWCPYHACQAGASDVERMCHSPRETAEFELSRGSRGGFEPTGARPRRLPPPNASVLIEQTPSARRPWVKLMLRVLRQSSKPSEEGDGAGDGRKASPHVSLQQRAARERASCVRAFDEAQSELRAGLPALY